MAILDILIYPDERLRMVAAPVERIDGDLQLLIDNMLETMYDAPGVGLAATQVGVNQRVVVIDVSEKKDQPLALINPEVLSTDGLEEGEEGCLSLPGVYEIVRRASRVVVRAQDRDGETVEIDADGLLGVCVQHEIDHLDGKLFVDYLSALKRNRIKKRLRKKDKEKSG